MVDDGTYKGAEIGNKNNLSLESVWGAADTTIDGRDGGGSTLYAHDSANLSIDGFTITGGTNIGSDPGVWGAGLDVNNCDSAKIKDNTAIDNERYGINVRLSVSATIENNTATNNGDDGIYLNGSNSATIINNTVTGNGDDGIYMYNSNSAIIENNTVAGNGSGIGVGASNYATIKNNTVTGNWDCGIYVPSSDNAKIKYNTVADNQQGGIYLGHSTGMIINQNNIYDNERFGLWNNQLNTVDAMDNWWGHAPPDYEGSVGVAGTPGMDIWDAGDELVDYTPWATEPY